MLTRSLGRATSSSNGRVCTASAPSTGRPFASLTASVTSQAHRVPHQQQHQRRPSSSKASIPPGGEDRGGEAAAAQPSKTAAQTVNSSSPGAATVGLDAKNDTAQTKRAYRRRRDVIKARHDENMPMEWMVNLPAVPSTNHLQIGGMAWAPTRLTTDVHTASFFSLGRPISVTSPIPPFEKSFKKFDKIFKTPTRIAQTKKFQEVFYTLSRVHAALNGEPTISPDREERLKWEVLSGDRRQFNHNAPGIPPLEDLLRQFRPFNVPPAPVPFEDNPNSSQHPSRTASTSRTTKDLSAFHTTQPSPSETTTAHQPFLQRMHARGADYTVIIREKLPTIGDVLGSLRNRRGRHMWTISVKRQRKLKMKKHKYKKLMRRTRNQRRRENRA